MGIDYGMGQTNIDHNTGIRYGVISMHDLSQYAWEAFEADYGDPTCPVCGNEAVEHDEDTHGEWEKYGYQRGCRDYACEHCEHALCVEDTTGDEPLGWTLDDGEHKATVGSDNDCFVLLSPYYTLAPFCSPCAPGACYLTGEGEDAKAYCFGHDWFDGPAPYAVYSVATGELVPAPE
jgi:hypothetical protein